MQKRTKNFPRKIRKINHGEKRHKQELGGSVHSKLGYWLILSSGDNTIKHGFPPDPWPMPITQPPRHSHRRLVWESTTAEIKEAWRLYHRFVQEGYLPYSVDEQGDPMILVNAFDPHAGELMFRLGDSR